MGFQSNFAANFILILTKLAEHKQNIFREI